MDEQEARALVVAECREHGDPMADEPWVALQFRGGWFLTPDGPSARDLVGFNGLVVTDDGQIHPKGSAMPPLWCIAEHLPDDGPNRRIEAVAVALARRFGDEQGGDLAGQDWVGTRFSGGWLFVPRADAEHPPVNHDGHVGVVVFDNGEIRRQAMQSGSETMAARLAAELEFGPG
jgi:hypothetical protein